MCIRFCILFLFLMSASAPLLYAQGEAAVDTVMSEDYYQPEEPERGYDTIRYGSSFLKDPFDSAGVWYYSIAYEIPRKWDGWSYEDEAIRGLAYPILFPTDDPKIAGINTHIKEILCGQTTTEAFKNKLLLNYRQSLNTYVRVYSEIDDTLGQFGRNPSVPEFMNASYTMEYRSPGIVTLVAAFTYRARIPDHSYYANSQSYEQTFTGTYYETWYFDLRTGKQFTPADVFKATSLKAMNALIEQQVAAQMRYVHDTIQEIYFYGEGDGEEDYYQQVHDRLNSHEKKLSGFSVSHHAVLFPQAVSMECMIPGNSPCTQYVYGREQHVRLPYEQIAAHVNPQGPFGFLAGYRQAPPLAQKAWVSDPDHYMDPLLMYVDTHHTPLSGPANSRAAITIQYAGKGNDGTAKPYTTFSRTLYYDAKGMLTLITGESGDTMQDLEFDEQKRLVLEAHPGDNGGDTEITRYTYDAYGNLIRSLKNLNEGRAIYYTYRDSLIIQEYFLASYREAFGEGFQICKTDSRGTVVHGTVPSASLIYDSLNRLIAIVPTATVSEDYDQDGHLLSRDVQPANPQYILRFAYDREGNLIRRQHDGTVITYAYDVQRRLTEEYYEGHYRNSFRYNSNGYLETLVRHDMENGNNRVLTYTYEWK